MLNRVPIEELKPLCGGTRARMTATLRSWGLTALPDIDGWPIVLRHDLERGEGLGDGLRVGWRACGHVPRSAAHGPHEHDRGRVF